MSRFVKEALDLDFRRDEILDELRKLAVKHMKEGGNVYDFLVHRKRERGSGTVLEHASRFNPELFERLANAYADGKEPKAEERAKYVAELRAPRRLFAAIDAGDVESVKEMLATHGGLNEPAFYEFPLHRVKQGDHEMLRLLLNAGADPNVLTALHETPLFLAVLGAEPDFTAVRMLFAYGVIDLDDEARNTLRPDKRKEFDKAKEEGQKEWSARNPERGTGE